MATAQPIVLPGDKIPSSALPTSGNPNKPLTLGPGLRHIPPNTITTTIAGALATDTRKNATWVEYNSGRYTPSPSDLVIATVHYSLTEAYNCTLTPHTPYANLPQLAFESATRKTRPILAPNSLVYARILSCTPHTAPELTCVDPSTGKAEGLGPLKGGMVFEISLGMARRLMLGGGKGGVVVLEALAEKVAFEVAVGRNGVLWVHGGEGLQGIKVTLAVGRAVQEVDEKCLGIKDQRKVVENGLKGL